MGMWAYEPWDNDAAADWYGGLMDKTQFREAWLDGITQDPEDSADVVRAASALFIMLGRVYVWPINTYQEDLERTITALSRVADSEDYKEVPELAVLIAAEIAELKSRRKVDGTDAAPPAPEPRPWWRFWK